MAGGGFLVNQTAAKDNQEQNVSVDDGESPSSHGDLPDQHSQSGEQIIWQGGFPQDDEVLLTQEEGVQVHREKLSEQRGVPLQEGELLSQEERANIQNGFTDKNGGFPLQEGGFLTQEEIVPSHAERVPCEHRGFPLQKQEGELLTQLSDEQREGLTQGYYWGQEDTQVVCDERFSTEEGVFPEPFGEPVEQEEVPKEKGPGQDREVLLSSIHRQEAEAQVDELEPDNLPQELLTKVPDTQENANLENSGIKVLKLRKSDSKPLVSIVTSLNSPLEQLNLNKLLKLNSFMCRA